MKKLSLFFKEVKDFRNFFKKTPRKDKDIVVYSEDTSYHSYFEGIIDYLTKVCNLRIVYVTSDPLDPLLSRRMENVKSFYIKQLLFIFTLLIDSKIILMTMPDLHQFHIKRSLLGANHVYLFHNIGSYFHVIRKGGLFHYDTLFCVGPHQVKEARREEEIYSLPKRKLVKFGYYRLDKAFEGYNRWKRENKDKKRSKYKAKILIAPGWGPWETRNSMIELYGSKLIRKLLEADYEVILRPHPMTRIKFPKFLDSLYNEFKDFDNFKSEENISSLESFYSSDLMICDWSGVVYEYAFGTERPVLFIDSPIKINNPAYKDFKIEPIDIKIRDRIGIVVGPDKIKDIDLIVAGLIKEKEKYKKEIIKARNEFVFNFGNSSGAGAKFICDYCNKNKATTN